LSNFQLNKKSKLSNGEFQAVLAWYFGRGRGGLHLRSIPDWAKSEIFCENEQYNGHWIRYIL